MDRYPIAASSLEKYYHINGDQFERQYKEHLSGFMEWEEASHASDWLVFPENFGLTLLKLFVETIIFIVNFFVSKIFIFAKKNRKKEKGNQI